MALEAGQYSAFGSTEPLYDSGGERIRWFCPWYISGSAAIERALEAVAQLEGAVNSSRNTLRIVSRGELSRSVLDVVTANHYRVEAAMPVNDDEQRIVTYIARCRSERRSSPEDVASERALIASITEMPRKGAAAITDDFCRLGDFEVEMVRPEKFTAADISQLVALHRATFPTFPYDFQSKLQLMLDDPAGYLMCQVRSRKNGRIYAFSNLELNTVAMDDGTCLRLAEYDNSIRVESSPDHGRVRGLGAILRLELARRASEIGVDLCHAESRASLAAINSNSYHLGMQFGGTLEKHLLISGASTIHYRSLSRFESMNVWYLDRPRLASLRDR